MHASKVTVNAKTYDLNYVGKKKKTALRRKLIVEYIHGKPSGELIKMGEFAKVAQLSSEANTYTFISRMIRDGVIARYDGEKPKTHYYSVLGTVRVKKPELAYNPETQQVHGKPVADIVVTTPDISSFIADMQRLGVTFTLTISNNKEA